jgi:hypothetical protein
MGTQAAFSRINATIGAGAMLYLRSMTITKQYNPLNPTTMSHEQESYGLHLGFKIAKLALQAATVAAAFCGVHELHKIHHRLKKEQHHKVLGK